MSHARLLPHSLTFAAAVIGLFCGTAVYAEITVKRGESAVVVFDGPAIKPPTANPQVKDDYNPAAERFFVHVPRNYNGTTPFGLVVFTWPADQIEGMPSPDWEPVLASHKLLFIAAQGVGNDQPANRRCGLAVMAALEMMQRYKIDPARVYAAGYSGGARVSGFLGFWEPSIFRGTIQSCGADFYAEVPKVTPRGPQERSDQGYGRLSATEDDASAAKANVRFVLITGTNDFRHGFITDIFHGGFEKQGFAAKLIDVPGMDHVPCRGAVLDAAIRFIETKTPAPADKSSTVASTAPAEDSQSSAAASALPPPPTWASKSPTTWPQILMHNDAVLRGNRGIGGSGFLMRLANGAVLAATVKHVIPDDIPLESLDKEVVTWSMKADTHPPREVKINKLAMKLAPGKAADCVLMTVRPRTSFPVEVLTPRSTPLELGEIVYVLGTPHGETASQKVYSGKVIHPAQGDDPQFWYSLDQPVETMGFSGAPLVDAHGYVVGIHCGGGTINGQPAKYATPITSALELADAPAVKPPAPPLAASPAHNVSSAANSAAPAVSSETEEAARHALNLAKNYVAVKMNERAVAKLQALIQQYPGTQAAAEAKALLATLTGQ